MTLKERDDASMQMVFYDHSDSNIEGTKYKFASPVLTRSHASKSKRVVLLLHARSKGEQFSWNILEDYTGDAKTPMQYSKFWI